MSEQEKVGTRCQNPRCKGGWVERGDNESGGAPAFPCRHENCPYREPPAGDPAARHYATGAADVTDPQSQVASIQWEHHSDLLRNQLQSTGRIRLLFLTLADLASAVSDLGIDPTTVIFRDGYAVVRDE